MSPSNDPAGDEQPSQHGEILKASSMDATHIMVGMPVTSLDGNALGKVKQVRDNEFLLERSMARDLWVPFSAVLATEDYSSAYRGPVRPTAVVLEVSEAHVDRQGWRHA